MREVLMVVAFALVALPIYAQRAEEEDVSYDAGPLFRSITIKNGDTTVVWRMVKFQNKWLETITFSSPDRKARVVRCYGCPYDNTRGYPDAWELRQIGTATEWKQVDPPLVLARVLPEPEHKSILKKARQAARRAWPEIPVP